MIEDLTALALIELRDEIGARARYLAALVIAGVLAVLGLAFAGLLVLVIAWDTPYRLHAAVGLMLVPLASAATIALVFLRRWRSDAWLEATRSEFKELYAWLKSKL